MASRKNRKQSEYFFDYTLLFIVLFLLGFGLIMVYSTSSYEASISANLKYDEAYYLKHQAFAAVMGFCHDCCGEYPLSFLGEVCDTGIFCVGDIDRAGAHTSGH